jgi:hypothetical protein
LFDWLNEVGIFIAYAYSNNLVKKLGSWVALNFSSLWSISLRLVPRDLHSLSSGFFQGRLMM